LLGYSASACSQGVSEDQYYDAMFSAEFIDDDTSAHASIVIIQNTQQVVSIDLKMPIERYHALSGEGEIIRQGSRVVWHPPAAGGRLSYLVTVERKRGHSYDARKEQDWLIMRLGDLFPAAKVRAKKGSKSRSSLSLVGPQTWSFETQYGQIDGLPKELEGGDRKYSRPTGWLVAGEIGTRRDVIGQTQVAISSPKGTGMQRLEMLAFLRWTLPELTQVFPTLPARLLIVGTPANMWRGGLSAPGSLYVNANRAFISENATSTLLHEIVHLSGMHSATQGSDWVVEGIAEYYSLLVTLRSDGISQQRFDRALAGLAQWAARENAELADPSKGADTAYAVTVIHALAQELAHSGQHIDELISRLLSEAQISAHALQFHAKQLLGKASVVLDELPQASFADAESA